MAGIILYHGSTQKVEFPEIRTARALSTLHYLRSYEVSDEKR